MLDVDHGTYPFVTSLHPAAGRCLRRRRRRPDARSTGSSAVMKAYTTRVGSGPFPTELFDADGEKLWKAGGEFGVSTGRDRRCGWYDTVIARYATRVNGLTDLFLTKLDVLSELGAGAGLRGLRHRRRATRRDADDPERVPPRQADLRVPRRLVGGHLRLPSFEELPVNAQKYVQALEEMSGTRIWGVGVGPGREQTLVVHEA